MKKILITPLIIFVIIFGLYQVSKVFVPPSIQVYLASVAGCDIDQQALAAEDPQFEQIKWWEYPLMHIYKFEKLYFASEFVITDFVTQNASVYHLLLVASDETKSTCNKEIFSLLNSYSKLGAPIDHYSDNGLTPLQEAVITKNVPFIKVLLMNGADLSLKTRISRPSIKGLDAIELAEYFVSKKPSNLKINAVLTALKNEI